jgi:hypothetical protein
MPAAIIAVLLGLPALVLYTRERRTARLLDEYTAQRERAQAEFASERVSAEAALRESVEPSKPRRSGWRWRTSTAA